MDQKITCNLNISHAPKVKGEKMDLEIVFKKRPRIEPLRVINQKRERQLFDHTSQIQLYLTTLIAKYIYEINEMVNLLNEFNMSELYDLLKWPRALI